MIFSNSIIWIYKRCTF